MINNDTLNAIVAIADERDRQLKVEGWTIQHDDTYRHGELARAAACYALTAADSYAFSTLAWPWVNSSFKPKGAHRDLVRAGALIVAELERITRRDAAREPQVLSGCAVRTTIQQEAVSPPTLPPNPEVMLELQRQLTELQRRQFMAAIDFAIEVAGTSGCGAGESFLREWREGDVSAWPEFKGPVPW